ncbi:Polyketide synthase modules and related protein-like protein [Parafrankia sp. EAN1pec]|nr:Polyketide synthase modules and related protein-like protein [Frankia sp. EAN1pec]
MDAAQASSLVAVYLAVESLRRGESDLAFAGGVQLNLAPESTLTADRFGALSPDGRADGDRGDGRAGGYRGGGHPPARRGGGDRHGRQALAELRRLDEHTSTGTGNVLGGLTPREREIATAAVGGKTSRKLGVSSRMALMMLVNGAGPR